MGLVEGEVDRGHISFAVAAHLEVSLHALLLGGLRWSFLYCTQENKTESVSPAWLTAAGGRGLGEFSAQGGSQVPVTGHSQKATLQHDLVPPHLELL